MNLVGVGGKGESVWLAWFLVDVLQGMIELSGVLGRSELSRSLRAGEEGADPAHRAGGMGRRMVSAGVLRRWNAPWLSANAEARIDSLPQSWASLSGGG